MAPYTVEVDCVHAWGVDQVVLGGEESCVILTCRICGATCYERPYPAGAGEVT